MCKMGSHDNIVNYSGNSRVLHTIDTEGFRGKTTTISLFTTRVSYKVDEITKIRKPTFTLVGNFNAIIPEALALVGDERRANKPTCNEASTNVLRGCFDKQFEMPMKCTTADAWRGVAKYIKKYTDMCKSHPETYSGPPVMFGHNIITELKGLLPENTEPCFGIRLTDSKLLNDVDNLDYYKNGYKSIGEVSKQCTFMLMDPNRLPVFMEKFKNMAPPVTSGYNPIISCSQQTVIKTMCTSTYEEKHDSFNDAYDLMMLLRLIISEYDGLDALTANTKSLINYKRTVIPYKCTEIITTRS